MKKILPPTPPLSTQQQSTLVAMMGLVRHIARRYHHYSLTRRDLEHEGAIGLADAIVRYNDTLGPPFETYAASMIKWAMSNALNRQRRHDGQVSLDAHSDDDLGGVNSLHERIPNNDRPVDDLYSSGIATEAMMKCVAELTYRERMAVELLHGLTGMPPMKTADVAFSLGVKETSVRALEKSATRKLRRVGLRNERER